MATEYYRTVLSFVCAGQFAQVVQHWGIVDPTNPNPFEVAQSFVEAFEADNAGGFAPNRVQAILSADCFLSSLRCRRISPSAGAEAIRVFPPTMFVGDFASTVESAGVAGCSIWIPSSEDGSTGRTFWPGVAEIAIDGGYFTSAYENAMNALITEIVDVGIITPPGTFLPYLKKGPLVAPTFSAIFSGYLSPSPATIRKRRTPF